MTCPISLEVVLKLGEEEASFQPQAGVLGNEHIRDLPKRFLLEPQMR